MGSDSDLNMTLFIVAITLIKDQCVSDQREKNVMTNQQAVTDTIKKDIQIMVFIKKIYISNHTDHMPIMYKLCISVL